jgi:hypothetical protein
VKATGRLFGRATIWFLVILAATLIAGAYWISSEPGKSQSEKDVATPRVQASSVARDGSSERADGKPATGDTRPRTGTPEPTPAGATAAAASDDRSGGVTLQVSEIRERSSEPWELYAFSAAEADWLRQRGYPVPTEWKERNTIAEAELDRRIALGDLAAHVYKAERLFRSMDPRDDAEAERLLEEAMIRGSAIAPQVEAAWRGVSNARSDGLEVPGAKDALSSARVLSPLLLAALMGDHQASAAIERFQFAGPSEFVVSRALASATSHLARINAERARRGWPPLDLTPRPGAEAWRRAFAEGGSLTIWPR